ncbi:hypothetical protein FV226_23385 [Methylobacterium sp. WL12]|uniref:hypothetical protein n=1 Tax=Methylobacterium sp. WL12 TaxID=2603890 RepID=UPI0011CC4812|nr:hypothetical protein [Methylobacterium sp. WL12]TXM66515.1 hypothetical protein FV226_23385 [Methylobacterium sp. WL12]
MARTTIGVRKSLEEAAGFNGVSLAQEVEDRLKQSFREPERERKQTLRETRRLGDEKTARIIREVVTVITSLGGDHSPDKEPLVREALKAGINNILNVRLSGWGGGLMAKPVGLEPVSDADVIHHSDQEAVERWKRREAMLAQIVLLNTEDKEAAMALPSSFGQDPAKGLFATDVRVIEMDTPKSEEVKGATKSPIVKTKKRAINRRDVS